MILGGIAGVQPTEVVVIGPEQLEICNKINIRTGASVRF